MNILKSYYKARTSGVFENDPTEQAKWLLSELSKHYYSRDDDSLIKATPTSQTSILADVEQLTKSETVVVEKGDQNIDSDLTKSSKIEQMLERSKHLEKLSILMDNIDRLQMVNDLKYKLKNYKEINVDEEVDNSNVKVKSKVKHVPGEL